MRYKTGIEIISNKLSVIDLIQQRGSDQAKEWPTFRPDPVQLVTNKHLSPVKYLSCLTNSSAFLM